MLLYIILILGAGDTQITEEINLLNKDFCMLKNIFLEVLDLFLSFHHCFFGERGVFEVFYVLDKQTVI